MPRETRKTPANETRRHTGSICITKLVIGVFGALLFASQHQRTLRQWQRFLQNSLQSAEFQAAIEPAFSSFNLCCIAIGISLIALAQICAPFRMKRQPQV